MQRNICVTLAKATTLFAAVALALTGCSPDETKNSSSTTPSNAPAPTSLSSAPPPAALPTPEALTDVLARLADPAVPGADKLNLVEGANQETAAALDRFTTASRDGGYLPMTFAANDIAWSDKNPSDVVAMVVVTTANPERPVFTFPMEFTRFQGGWQLSKRTAETLLALQKSGGSTTAPQPSSAPPPAPTGSPAPAPTGPGPSPEPSPSPSPTG